MGENVRIRPIKLNKEFDEIFCWKNKGTVGKNKEKGPEKHLFLFSICKECTSFFITKNVKIVIGNKKNTAHPILFSVGDFRSTS